MPQTFPIILQPLPALINIKALNFNQLLVALCQNISGSISLDVAFFGQGATNPSTLQTLLFFNTTTQQLYSWDTGLGAYVIITQFRPGDTKFTFAAGDEVSAGWVVLNGRLLSSLTALSVSQMAVLTGFFGTGATVTLPTITPWQTLANLPTVAQLNAIPFANVLPATGTFSGLAFSDPATGPEVTGFAADTEILLTSTAATTAHAKSVRDYVVGIINSLTASGAPFQLFAKIYVGAA